jgi:hypothetical protein
MTARMCSAPARDALSGVRHGSRDDETASLALCLGAGALASRLAWRGLGGGRGLSYNLLRLRHMLRLTTDK